MTTINEIVAETENLIVDNKEHEQIVRAQLERLIKSAEADGRNSLTENEDIRSQAMFRDIEATKAARKRLNSRLDKARQVQAEDIEFERRSHEFHPANLPTKRTSGNYDQTVRIGNEERTYDRGNDPRGEHFLQDVGRAFMFGDAEANQRLARHTHEMRVDRQSAMQERGAGDALVSDFPGLVVPQFLVNDYQGKPNNARPFADRMTHRNLPAQGMTITLARGTDLRKFVTRKATTCGNVIDAFAEAC